MRKGVKIALGCAGVALVLFVVSIFALAAIFDSMISEEEVARVPSPTGNVQAVTIETNGGATTSYGYMVFIVPAGAPESNGRQVAYVYGAIGSDGKYGVTPRWTSPGSLTIEYQYAVSAELIAANVIVANQRIRVTLESGVTDSVPPDGAMSTDQNAVTSITIVE